MHNLFSVDGKVVVVTGGSRGIGEMLAEGYMANGASRVYITARKADVCDATAERLNAVYDGECVSLPIDLSTSDGIASIVAAVAKREQRLDVLVNNAGAAWGAPIDEFPESGWDKVMNVNVKAMFFLTQKCLPLLRAAANPVDPARVINIGSVDGLRIPRSANFSYSASKAAVHHMTRVLASELAHENIIVNGIAPGPFQSKMMAASLAAHGEAIAASVPRQRIGQPEDIAGTAIFLSSRASAYMTGATIPCDGGISTAGRMEGSTR
ncbi:MAG: 3-oxoacyl-ACP reductase [Gammaproteobacteria bacterium]|nr:3-oxoacyl-ACP reductase [Gammaproteobacteria bacterium]|tara:strand:+ start:2015 stop:2815 length:801 start_codon:yes stop_codon:yes gene_type:complete